jgi:hypothetical protein
MSLMDSFIIEDNETLAGAPTRIRHDATRVLRLRTLLGLAADPKYENEEDYLHEHKIMT